MLRYVMVKPSTHTNHPFNIKLHVIHVVNTNVKYKNKKTKRLTNWLKNCLGCIQKASYSRCENEPRSVRKWSSPLNVTMYHFYV